MEIVIKIDDKRYKDIQRIATVQLKSNYFKTTEQIIASGTPLPKGHGRLIDADAYIDKHGECGWLDDITINEFNAIAPTIIEADKAESEDK